MLMQFGLMEHLIKQTKKQKLATWSVGPETI